MSNIRHTKKRILTSYPAHTTKTLPKIFQKHPPKLFYPRVHNPPYSNPLPKKIPFLPPFNSIPIISHITPSQPTVKSQKINQRCSFTISSSSSINSCCLTTLASSSLFFLISYEISWESWELWESGLSTLSRSFKKDSDSSWDFRLVVEVRLMVLSRCLLLRLLGICVFCRQWLGKNSSKEVVFFLRGIDWSEGLEARLGDIRRSIIWSLASSVLTSRRISSRDTRIQINKK